MLSSLGRTSIADMSAGAWPGWEGLGAGYLLNETSGARVDVLGANDLSPDNAPGYTDVAVEGNAVDFVQASSQKLYAASDPAFQATAADGLTVAFWIYNDINSAAGYLGRSSGGGGIIEWYFAQAGADTGVFGITFTVLGGDGDWGDYAYTTIYPATPTRVTLNAWHLIVAWLDPADGKTYMALDGEEGLDVQNSALTLDPYHGTMDLEVGYTDAGIPFMDGKMDLLYIWPKMLVSEYRGGLWNGGSGLVYPNAP